MVAYKCDYQCFLFGKSAVMEKGVGETQHA